MKLSRSCDGSLFAGDVEKISQEAFADDRHDRLGVELNSFERQLPIMEYYLAKFPATFTLLWKLKDLTKVCNVYHKMKGQIRGYMALKKYMRQHCGTYADLSREMQRIEAKMFFEEILPQVDQPFITIHDSVVVQAGKPSNVGDIIKRTFKEKENIIM